MKTIYLDCFAGIRGNMLLGALLHAGVPEQALRNELRKLSVSEYDLIVKRVNKCGINAVHAHVLYDRHDYRLADLIAIIDSSDLAEKVKEGSKQVFMKLAQAEAKVHGVSINDIQFQVDVIVDTVGTVFGFYFLGVEKVAVSKVCVGSGFVECVYGVMPVPTPATAELLTNIPYYAGEISREMTTPTGAAILAVFATKFGEKPENFISEKIGYGAGTRDFAIPNVLRLYIGYIDDLVADEVMVLEANIDDLNPQLYPYTMDKLFAAGAFDVWIQSVIMKKGRPGNVLSVLCERAKLDVVIGIILAETSSIGVRYYKANRTVAKRKFVMVSTEYGETNIKVSLFKGQVTNVTPEYEDLKQLASQHNIPLKVVQQAAWAAANKLYAKE